MWITELLLGKHEYIGTDETEMVQTTVSTSFSHGTHEVASSAVAISWVLRGGNTSRVIVGMLVVVGIEKPVNVELCLEGRLGVVSALYFGRVGVEVVLLGHGEEGCSFMCLYAKSHFLSTPQHRAVTL